VSVEVILTRPAAAISLLEWTRLVEEDDDLRLRRKPIVATNPTTGSTISIKAGQADAEIHVNGHWVPFLRFSNGRLATKYVEDLDDPQNAKRLKIGAVAKRLGALIKTDAGGDLLSW
jgi:hypothetical protein